MKQGNMRKLSYLSNSSRGFALEDPPRPQPALVAPHGALGVVEGKVGGVEDASRAINLTYWAEASVDTRTK